MIPSELSIRPARPADAAAVAAFCQPIYAAVYPNKKYGLKPEHFSPEIFQTADTLAYFAGLLTRTDNKIAYIAETNGHIGGTIGIERLTDCYEIHAFYIDPALRGQGLGRRLFAQAMTSYLGELPVKVEVAETNTGAISLYAHWGFRPLEGTGVEQWHWPEWPDGIVNGYVTLLAQPDDLIRAFPRQNLPTEANSGIMHAQ